MSKSFRVSLVCVGLVMGVSQVAFAGVVTQSKDQAASAETSKSSVSQKSKKKKKSKDDAPAVIVLGAYAQPTVSEPASLTPVAGSTTSDAPTVAPAPRPRGTVSARKITGISVSPDRKSVV